jgi:hypothetical protein
VVGQRALVGLPAHNHVTNRVISAIITSVEEVANDATYPGQAGA